MMTTTQEDMAIPGRMAEQRGLVHAGTEHIIPQKASLIKANEHAE